jgi:hypothetical protein
MENMESTARWAELGKLLRKRRTEVLRLPQKDIQKAGGPSVTFQSAIENGHIPNKRLGTPSDKMLSEIEGVFGLEPGSLNAFLDGEVEDLIPRTDPARPDMPLAAQMTFVQTAAGPGVATHLDRVSEKKLLSQIGLTHIAATALNQWEAGEVSNETMKEAMWRLINASAETFGEARGVDLKTAHEVGRAVAQFLSTPD